MSPTTLQLAPTINPHVSADERLTYHHGESGMKSVNNFWLQAPPMRVLSSATYRLPSGESNSVSRRKMLNANWLTSYANHTTNATTASVTVDMSRPQTLAVLDGFRGSVGDDIRGDKAGFLKSLFGCRVLHQTHGAMGLVQYTYQLLLKVRYRTNQ